MKIKSIIFATFFITTLIACNDDTGFGPNRQNGYLYFNCTAQ